MRGRGTSYRLWADGFPADLLEITTDDFGGPYDIVFANAVLLHLTAGQLGEALAKAARAVTSQGLLAFSVKEGRGDTWSTGEARTTAVLQVLARG